MLLTFIFIGNLFTVYAQDDFPYDRYKPRTLSETISLDPEGKNADVIIEKKSIPQMVAYTNLLYSQVRVKFMNKSRPLSVDRKETLDLWKKTLAMEDKTVSLYENEYLFNECNNEYRIPVQKQVAAFFPKELKEGDMISLFITRIGAKKINDSWDWLFLSTEFIK